MSKEKRKIINIHRPNAYYQIIGKVAVVGYAAFVSTGGLILGVQHLQYLNLSVDALAAFVFVILYGAIAWRVYYHAFVDKIIVSSEGLEVGGWHQAFADWNTLSHFETQPAGRGRNKRLTDGILTTKPVAEHKSRVWFDYDFTDNFIPLSHIYKIPYRMKWTRLRAEIDLDKFVQTPLGQDLLHYAPHLFEKDKHS